MSVDSRLDELERQLKQLQVSVRQMCQNNTEQVNKLDNTSNRVTAITPYTDSKTAYIRDTKVVFENVPQGNLSVFGLNEYHVERVSDNIVVTFEPLENVTTVSISIQ